MRNKTETSKHTTRFGFSLRLVKKTSLLLVVLAIALFNSLATLAVCGDNIIDPGETCDGDNLGPYATGSTCGDLGFLHNENSEIECVPPGSDDECHFNITVCIETFGVCGDGELNQGLEECDVDDLLILGCDDYKEFSSGITSCTSTCQVDTTLCSTSSSGGGGGGGGGAGSPTAMTLDRGELTIPDDLVVYGDLEVMQEAEFNDDVQIDGHLEVEGDLDVEGIAFFEEDVDMFESLYVEEDVQIEESLYVDGVSSLGTLFSGNSSFFGNVELWGNVDAYSQFDTRYLTAGLDSRIDDVRIHAHNGHQYITSDFDTTSLWFATNYEDEPNWAGIGMDFDDGGLYLTGKSNFDESSLFISDQGNVRIGHPSDDVEQDLDVRGDVLFKDDSNTHLYLDSPGKSRQQDNALIFWRDADGNNRYYLGLTEERGDLKIHNYDAGITQLTFDRSGNVGVAVPSPTTRLDVNGGGRFRGNLGVNTASNKNYGVYSYLNKVNPAANGGAVRALYQSRFSSNSNKALYGTLSYTQPNPDSGVTASGASIAVYGLSQNIGAGTASHLAGVRGYVGTTRGPITTGYALFADCNHAATCYGLFISGDRNNRGTDWGVYATGEQKNYFSGRVGIKTKSPGFALDINGRARSDRSTFITSSDERLKDISGQYSYGLNEVSQLQPVEFSYKTDNPLGHDSSTVHSGLIAQQVQEVIPQAVEQQENGYLTVSSDPILWAMLNAIKELKAQNEELTKRVEALE